MTGSLVSADGNHDEADHSVTSGAKPPPREVRPGPLVAPTLCESALCGTLDASSTRTGELTSPSYGRNLD